MRHPPAAAAQPGVAQVRYDRLDGKAIEVGA